MLFTNWCLSKFQIKRSPCLKRGFIRGLHASLLAAAAHAVQARSLTQAFIRSSLLPRSIPLTSGLGVGGRCVGAGLSTLTVVISFEELPVGVGGSCGVTSVLSLMTCGKKRQTYFVSFVLFYPHPCKCYRAVQQVTSKVKGTVCEIVFCFLTKESFIKIWFHLYSSNIPKYLNIN